MRRFEIFVAPEPAPAGAAPYRDVPDSRGGQAVSEAPAAASDRAVGEPQSGVSVRRERRRAAREVLDIFIGGANVTARVKSAQASCVLRDLGAAIADLSRKPRGKAIVRFYDDPWEMCVERFGAACALSVYRSGSDPFVPVYDRIVSFREVVESTRDAIELVLSTGTPPRPVGFELEAAACALRAITEATSPPFTSLDDGVPAPAPVVIEIDRDAPLSFGAELALRTGPEGDTDPSVERADLHALLFPGRLRAEIRGRVVELSDGHPFLFAEGILDMSRRALDAWERGVPYHVRRVTGGVLAGVRVTEGGQLALTLGAAPDGSPPSSTREATGPVLVRAPPSSRSEAEQPSRRLCTFPALSVTDVVEAALAFGRSLVRALLRRDRSQCTNLRLSAFRRQLRDTSEALRELSRRDEKINPTPELYRAFVAGLGAAAATPRIGASPMRASTRLRYAARWRALVPGIDLRATFLCGDRLVVGAAQETFCLERATGNVLWRTPTERATSVVTPGGIARLSPDGTLSVHDFGNGEVTLRTKLAARVGGPASGIVVHGPGLPRLLIVTEGEEHLVAIDLTSGEPRWRFTWGKKSRRGKRGALRLKRAGKLVYFTSGDSAIAALDVLTGAIVWRTRDRLRFRSPPTFDHDMLYAVAGGVNCLAHLHAIDPFAGSIRWTARIAEGLKSGPRRGPASDMPPFACSIEGSPLAAGSAIAVAVRDRSALRLVAFDRDTGAQKWSSRGPIAPIGTSWLAIDDLFIGNTPTGEIVAVDAATGELRYRRVLGPRVLEADVPRRLEPVLRCGALFVPHVDVHVLRPQDGEEIATIAPCEAIPDLLRVDERCDVYVAEESGHLVSFSALARLSLVRSEPSRES